MTAFWEMALQKKAAISEAHTVSIITLTTEAICTCETPVYFFETTGRYIPEGSHLRLLYVSLS
jgi:hypothetical protein